jgi:hypothetical protein
VPLLGKAKKVFVLHGSEWFVIKDQFLWYDRIYLKHAVPVYFRFANAIIAVSRAVKRDAVKAMAVSEEKVAAIQNGFDPAVFRVIEDRDRLRRVATTYVLPERFILWVGQIESRKNIGRLLQAFARIKDRIPHQLVLAGEQRFSFPMAAGAARDLKLIEDLGLKDRVHFTGWIPHEDLAAVYALADLFAFPSLHEGFGIPLLEAMACACPIMTANTCAPPEVVGEAGFLVDPLSVDDIAAGMLEALTDDSLRETKVAYGLQRVKNFSWEKCASEILALFETLAHPASRWQETSVVVRQSSGPPHANFSWRTISLHRGVVSCASDRRINLRLRSLHGCMDAVALGEGERIGLLAHFVSGLEHSVLQQHHARIVTQRLLIDRYGRLGRDILDRRQCQGVASDRLYGGGRDRDRIELGRVRANVHGGERTDGKRDGQAVAQDV